MKLKKTFKIFIIILLIAISMCISSECILRMNIYEYIFAQVSAHQAFHKAVRLCKKNQEEIKDISTDFFSKVEYDMSGEERNDLCKWFEEEQMEPWMGKIASMDYPDYGRRLKDRVIYCYKDFCYNDNYAIQVCAVEIIYINAEENAREIIEKEYFSGERIYHNLEKINEHLYVVITQWTNY